MISYRDPNVRETYEVYDQLPDLIESLELDQETLDGYILSNYSSLALPSGELSGASTQISLLLGGYPEDLYLQYMHEMKSMTPETIREYAPMYRKLVTEGVRTSSGSAVMINGASDLFDSIITPFSTEE